jgi:hypothetical protein
MFALGRSPKITQVGRDATPFNRDRPEVAWEGFRNRGGA